MDFFPYLLLVPPFSQGVPVLSLPYIHFLFVLLFFKYQMEIICSLSPFFVEFSLMLLQLSALLSSFFSHPWPLACCFLFPINVCIQWNRYRCMPVNNRNVLVSLFAFSPRQPSPVSFISLFFLSLSSLSLCLILPLSLRCFSLYNN